MGKKQHNLLAILILTFSSITAHANDAINIKAGFAFDMGFGVNALVNDQYYFMLGNDGVAADYLVTKGTFKSKIPFTWYVAGGAYNEWDDGSGVRLPLGVNLNLSEQWNGYTQISPDVDFDEEVRFGAQMAAGIRYSF